MASPELLWQVQGSAKSACHRMRALKKISTVRKLLPWASCIRLRRSSRETEMESLFDCQGTRAGSSIPCGAASVAGAGERATGYLSSRNDHLPVKIGVLTRFRVHRCRLLEDHRVSSLPKDFLGAVYCCTVLIDGLKHWKYAQVKMPGGQDMLVWR